MPKHLLESKVLVLKNSPDDLEDEDNINKAEFYQVKKQTISLNASEYEILSFYNVSQHVKYKKLIGEKRLLQMINALVSHEMRNPLNSINSMILKIRMLHT